MDPTRTSIPSLVAPMLAVIFLASFATANSEEAAAIVSGPWSVQPALGLYAVHDDNVYTTPDLEFDSWIFVQAPSLLVALQPSQHRFEFEYAGEFGQYAENSSDDYDDHLFAARAFFDFTRRSKLDIVGSIFDGHHERGSGLTRETGPSSGLFPDSPDEYTDTDLRAEYRFGSKGARGRIDVEAGSLDREYDNHRNRTRFFDRKANFAGVSFYYGFRPNTSLVLDAFTKDISYRAERVGEASRDATEYRYRLGITWEVTENTRGRISVGHVSKDFDSPQRPKFSAASWEADVRWSPRSFTYFDFKTAREPRETLGEGDFIDALMHEVSWTHNWSDAWQSRLAYRYQDEEFVGISREEQLTQTGLELRYQMRRWLRWDMGVEARSSDSTIRALEYDATVFKFGVELGL